MMDPDGNIVLYIGQPWSTGGTLVERRGNNLVIRRQDGSEYLVSKKGFSVSYCIAMNSIQRIRHHYDSN